MCNVGVPIVMMTFMIILIYISLMGDLCVSTSVVVNCLMMMMMIPVVMLMP